MGQRQTSQLQEFVSPMFSQILSEEPLITLLSDEIHTLTYERFVSLLRELNLLSKQCLNSEGKQLIFAVKKGTDTTVFWKATVLIACVKFDQKTQKVDTYRLLSLSEFLNVCKTLTCQCKAVEQSQSDVNGSASGVGATFNSQKSNDSSKECCICFERKQEVILPCAHSYCLPCIEEWNESHDTCPICREKLESTDDTWVLSEVPEAEEICKEIQSNLMELTKDSSEDSTDG